ncbi:alpha/beta fold hydrolase [Streptomyces sclerotialus]|uniref:alpha/beta fold hydrolase n=1 Tax=Streptomyces sclerotialus TaxID=1957 RepID=UPI0004C8B54E
MPQPSPVPSRSVPETPVPEPRHRSVRTPGGRIHLVEQGTGPLVLFLHGFPESWYSWRHQLPAVAAAGYRAVAIDVRGYGRSSAPGAVDAYRMLEHVADNAAVIEALGAGSAVVVGHDWGSPIAANTALLRPELVSAVGLLSVPYAPRGGPRPSEVFSRIGGDEEFYVSYFQEPGRAEAEIEPDVRGWLAGFYAGLSADTMPPAEEPGLFFVPRGARMRDRFPTGALPAWLTEAVLDHYAGEFERTGLTGALNRYRNADRDWADLAPWDGAPVTQPSLFLGGALDASAGWLSAAIEAFPKTLPGLVSCRLLEGCGHWIQQERPAEVNRILLDWLGSPEVGVG